MTILTWKSWTNPRNNCDLKTQRLGKTLTHDYLYFPTDSDMTVQANILLTLQ